MSDRSRYIIGIDLGTTNSSVSYVDTDANHTIQPFRIPQLNSAGYLESLAALPSSCYLIPSHERQMVNLGIPWAKERNYVVGNYAHAQSGKAAFRVVESVKSWLCNTAANRRDKILPLDADSADERLSPIEASTYYLNHIREAWNHTIAKNDPRAEFEQQEIILTVPASFDEVARLLTIEAAKAAGFSNMTLLEEPQAAFYSWITQHQDEWQKELKNGDCVLICDVGGGTTDFSLIEVIESDKQLAFQRMAVGNHLLLGGDNMDAAIAHFLEKKIARELDASQWRQLKYHARCAKEAIMSDGCKNYQAVIQGIGSSVIQQTLTTEIGEDELRHLLENGFFGQHNWDEAIQVRKTSGMRTMGLPYEDEPSITKQLAYFLSKNPGKIPSHILFNGGSMKPPSFQEAIIKSLERWFPHQKVHSLHSSSLDFAVASGAAYFGIVRRGFGIRIGGGSSRAYYLGIGIAGENGSSEQKALTIMPRGCEEGYLFEPKEDFWLLPNTPIAFDLYASHVRIDDKAGIIIPIDLSMMQKLPPINTQLRFGNKSQEKIKVHLSVRLTEIGTIELWLSSQKTNHKWFLEFQLRSSEGLEDSLKTLQKVRVDQTFDTTYLKEAHETIKEIFTGSIPQKMTMEILEKKLQTPKDNWPLSILRGLWPTLLEATPLRKRSNEHEMRWWNLAGILLKPGVGYPLDDFRLKELWKIILSDLQLPKAMDVDLQQCVCFRRIAHGLNKGQQIQLAHYLFPLLTNKRTGKVELKGKSEEYRYSERIRTLGELELLEIPFKIKLGSLLLNRIISGDALESEYWAFGRIGARQLLYGSIANIVPLKTCLQWLEQLIETKKTNSDRLLFVISQLTRKTGQREYNIPQEMIEKILKKIPDNQRLQMLMEQETPLTAVERERIYGEQLPPGLLLEEKK